MTEVRYRFTRQLDAAVYLVTTPLQFVWILLFFVVLPRYGLALVIGLAFVVTVLANGTMFRRASREAGTRYTVLNGVGTSAGRACLRAAWVRLRDDKETPTAAA